MPDFNDFGFSTVSEDEYRAQQTTHVDTAKEVASTATASLQPELDKIFKCSLKLGNIFSTPSFKK